MDIRWLEAFEAVADELNFSAGANRLYISQSVASKYILRLEEELGVCLFDRSRRQISLTPTGEELLPQVKILLSQYRYMLKSLQEKMILHIAVPPVADSYGITQLLVECSSVISECTLQIEEQQNLTILSMLEKNQLDGAFCRIFPPYSNTQNCIPFHREQMVLLVADNGQQSNVVKLADYKDRRFLFLDHSTGLWETSMNLCLESGFVPDICYTGSNRDNITRLVLENAGVALLAEGVARQCLQPGIIMLNLEHSAESQLVFISSKNGAELPEMMRFMVFLKEKTADRT